MKRTSKRSNWIISALLMSLVFIRCCYVISVEEMYPDPPPLYKSTLTTYNVQQYDIQSLQYYLSHELRLYQGTGHNYEYRNHGIQLQDHHRGDIVFRADLPGKWIDQRQEGVNFFFLKKKRILVVHFENPSMSLDFKEDNDGKFRLITENKKGRIFTNFKGKSYRCVSPNIPYLKVASFKKPDTFGKDLYIEGAKYDGEKICWFPWELLVAAGALILFAQYLENQ